MEITKDQNKTERKKYNKTTILLFAKNRAAKKAPTGMDIKIGEKKAIPINPYFLISLI